MPIGAPWDRYCTLDLRMIFAAALLDNPRPPNPALLHVTHQPTAMERGHNVDDARQVSSVNKVAPRALWVKTFNPAVLSPCTVLQRRKVL